MKLVLFLFLAVATLRAQVGTEQGSTYARANSIFDFTGAGATSPAVNVTSLPGTCTVGQQAFKTNATAGQNLYGCTSTNTWTLQSGGGSSGNALCSPQTGSGSVAPNMSACTNLVFTLTGNATAVAIPTGINSANSIGQITWVLSGGTWTLSGLDSHLVNWCSLSGVASGQYVTQFFHYDGTNMISDGCSASDNAISGATFDTANNTFKIAGTTVNAVQGNAAKVALVSGSFTNGNCRQTDASGNEVDSGAACGGGGSAPYTCSIGSTSTGDAVAMTGSDITLFTCSSVTMPSGTCLTASIQFETSPAGGNATFKMNVGATNITSITISQNQLTWMNLRYCNAPASTTVQHLYGLPSFYIGTGTIPNAQMSFVWVATTTPTGVNFGSSQTVTFTLAQASGNAVKYNATLNNF